MLKRLGDWLDSFTDFAYDHPAFTTVTVIILAIVAAVALWLTLELTCGTVASEPSIQWEGDVTLQDTRRVHCIRFTNGDVSCDWSRADGSDNL